MKRILLLLTLLGGFTAFAQGTVTGVVTDTELGGPLPGANVVESGTSNGAVTDFNGNFTLEVSGKSGSLDISFLGFLNESVSFTLTNGKAKLGNINMAADANTLSEVVILGSGIIDLAEDRKTPVAVSTITAEQIQLKSAGNREFMESIQYTPSVYVSNQSGGFGDSQVFLRGFDQVNTAFLLNGQPINGMEDGRMYWSNWSGMADVAQAAVAQVGAAVGEHGPDLRAAGPRLPVADADIGAAADGRVGANLDLMLAAVGRAEPQAGPRGREAILSGGRRQVGPELEAKRRADERLGGLGVGAARRRGAQRPSALGGALGDDRVARRPVGEIDLQANHV